MEREYNRENVTARLIANTRRKKRYDDLVEIARQIRWLEKDLGSLKEVSKTIGISRDQLHQFLSVEKLSPEVKKLVEDRKIDLINTVHYMRNFDHKAQKEIADAVVNKGLTAGDIRVLAPLGRDTDYQNVQDLISRVRGAKNVKLYVLYFHVPRALQDGMELEGMFKSIVGESEVHSLTTEGSTGILEITERGRAKLREEARKQNLSLRAFVGKIVRMAREMAG
jgi:uncharacterized protein (UPF0335 family)